MLEFLLILGDNFTDIDPDQLGARNISDNILTSSNGNSSAVLFTPIGILPEDDDTYLCLLIFEGSVIYNRTVRIVVNVPEGPGRSIYIRFSTQPQDELDEFLFNFYGLPSGLPSLSAIVRKII